MTSTFSQLKKLSKQPKDNLPVARVALLCDSSSQLINIAISGAGMAAGFNFEIFEGDYDQIDMQILDPDSDLYRFAPEIIVINQNAEHLRKRYFSSGDKVNFDKTESEHMRTLLNTARTHSKALIIINTFPEIFDSVFGNYGATQPDSFVSNIRRINLSFSQMAAEFTGLLILDLAALISNYGYRNIFDSKMHVTSDLVYNLDFLPILASEIVKIICASKGKFKKCIILDLDNTLWGGIIGDDGVEGIQIGNLGIGKAFSNFQQELLALKNRGIILAVCSKNTEAIAKEAFERHPEMVLQLDDFAMFVANWENKVDNILHIQEVLNIGMDSIVFFDDNPFEREMVKSAIPLITVPDLPEDPAEYPLVLRELNLFETVSRSEEDVKRTEQYREEAKRISLRKSFNNEGEYLKSLEMACEVSNFGKFNIPRIAQLSQRSNQFNLRTIRLNEQEVAGIASSDQYYSLAFNLSDIYGDYGLIAYIILEKESNDTVFIHSWVMSCRVLKRKMEEFTLSCIIDYCRSNGIRFIKGEYIPSAKNGLVKDHYKNLNFVWENEAWQLDLQKSKAEFEFQIKKIQINEQK